MQAMLIFTWSLQLSPRKLLALQRWIKVTCTSKMDQILKFLRPEWITQSHNFFPLPRISLKTHYQKIMCLIIIIQSSENIYLYVQLEYLNRDYIKSLQTGKSDPALLTRASPPFFSALMIHFKGVHPFYCDLDSFNNLRQSTPSSYQEFCLIWSWLVLSSNTLSF